MDVLRKTGPNSWECKLAVYRVYVRFADGVYTASVYGRHLQDMAKFESTDIRNAARQCREWITSVSSGRH